MQVSIKHLFVIVLLAAAVIGCTAPKVSSQVEAQTVPVSSTQVPRTITVVGSGQVSLAPDVAEINIGAEARAPSVADAKAQVDAQIDTILATLRELGIAEKDIQTSSYNIYYERESYPPVMREGDAQQEQGGYRVSNTLRVTVRDIEQVGNVLDAVVEAGANQVYGVNFTVSDRKKWESDARAGAFADAKARAEELAGLAGVELGQVLSISEVVGSSPMPVAYAVERAAGGGGIAPGELEFGMQVQVTFAIQ